MVGSSTTKWGKNNITWYIYPPQFSPVAERAFSTWSKHANLNFIRSHNSPNISIAFVRGKHLCFTNKSTYCYSPFVDGSSILAHAEYPSTDKEAVEILLIDAITWHDTLTLPSTINDDTSLFWVLVHEVGLGLGLSHTADARSIMFSSYNFPPVSSFDELDLYEEEIRAIQMLYGPPPKPPPSTTPTKSTTTTTTTSTTTTTPATTKRSFPPTNQPFMDVCYYLKHIEAFLVAHKRLYLFYNNYVWIIPLQESIRLQRDYTRPKMINRWLRFLPANFTHVSDIYQRPNIYIVMIANYHIYIFTYPHLQLTY
ncbi:matrix metalloproteinase-17-like [Rhodnius prolixus]|uniref:Metallo proteinase Y n=2 Tax=Rhodnius prolixus TaxID=13249 RepID=A0A141FNZ5_RHOPR|nr:Metallo proteinase Y [Rhodnius prolixus]